MQIDLGTPRPIRCVLSCFNFFLIIYNLSWNFLTLKLSYPCCFNEIVWKMLTPCSIATSISYSTWSTTCVLAGSRQVIEQTTIFHLHCLCEIELKNVQKEIGRSLEPTVCFHFRLRVLLELNVLCEYCL